MIKVGGSLHGTELYQVKEGKWVKSLPVVYTVGHSKFFLDQLRENKGK